MDNDFAKILLIMACRTAYVLRGILAYVECVDKRITHLPDSSITEVYQEVNEKMPMLIFVGDDAEPLVEIEKLAQQETGRSVFSCSLGQGQGPRVITVINGCMKHGDWVVLYDCHLATKWLRNLEEMFFLISDDAEDSQIHHLFRIFLIARPDRAFPIQVVNYCATVTVVGPIGVRSHLARALEKKANQPWGRDGLSIAKRRMHYIIVYFHAVMCGRVQFGHVGFNQPYKFSFRTLSMCQESVLALMTDAENIPYNAIHCTIGQLYYGSKVWDEWDFRCIQTVLDTFVNKEKCQGKYDDVYKVDSQGVYKIPAWPSKGTSKNDTQHFLEDFVEKMSYDDQPSLYGMHANAAALAHRAKSENCLAWIRQSCNIQPATEWNIAGASDEEVEFLYGIVESVKEKLQLNFKDLRVDPNKSPFARFLSQEVARYASAVNVLYDSVEEISLSLFGAAVLTDRLESVSHDIRKNIVPDYWRKHLYPTCMSLAGFLEDLLLRNQFVRKWVAAGPQGPICFMMSYIFLPVGFLTAVLQQYAFRRNNGDDRKRKRNNNEGVSFGGFDVNTLSDVDKMGVREESQGFSKRQTFIDELQFTHEVTYSVHVAELSKRADAGVFMYGPYLNGARWDAHLRTIEDCRPGQTFVPMPVIQLIPELRPLDMDGEAAATNPDGFSVHINAPRVHY